MAVIQSFVRNPVTLTNRSGTVPIYKTEDFDGYNFVERGVTGQFIEEARTYYDRYTNSSHFKSLYSGALTVAKLSNRRPIRVLDITGGGNSLFAILEIIGKIEAIGIDISQPLLELCGRHAKEDYEQSENISLLCADLFDLNIIPESADIVTGSSILHHMLDPAKIVEVAVKALRKGGCVIFIEPFEDGHGLLRGIYETILALEGRSQPQLPSNIAKYMKLFIKDFDARRGVGNLRPFTQHLDDKWFFTRTWFLEQAHKLGFSKVTIQATHGGAENFLTRQFEAGFQLYDNGEHLETLPEWAVLIFDIFNGTYSPLQKNDICFTGIITMQK